MNVKDITKNMVSERKTKEDSNFVRIIKGSILSIILTIICLLIFSLILAYTNIPEKTMIPVITAVTAISILAGSIISVSKKGNNQWNISWINIYINNLYNIKYSKRKF